MLKKAMGPLFATLTMAATLAGCAGSPTYQHMYEGEKKPDSELATVHIYDSISHPNELRTIASAEITHVNHEPIEGNHLKLEPGTYIFDVSCKHYLDRWVDTKRQTREGTKRLAATLEPGTTYKLSFYEDGNRMGVISGGTCMIQGLKITG
ncbi:MAG TPA: hypothetical protein VK972_01855 [Wenzhouxiangella sp.]|nr:hypothetical protein [Wenzhouxiangella sp.]